MDRRAWILFLLLAAIWGASYMFIEIGLADGLPPAAIACARTALAALVLLPIAARMGALAGLRERLLAIALLALVQVAAPFLLISFGQEEITSSMAGILVATMPIFTFMLAFAVAHEERAGAAQLTGVAIGLGGVALLLGVDAGGSGAALAGGLMVVLASLGYALGAYYLKRRFAGFQPVGIVAATMSASALWTLPFVLAELPFGAPDLGASAAILTLGVAGTGIAFVIYYWLIAKVGASKTSLVAYVAPGFAVVYGVTLLGESFTAATAAGMVAIVGGSWIAAEGGLPWIRSAAGGELATGVVEVATEPDGSSHRFARSRQAGRAAASRAKP